MQIYIYKLLINIIIIFSPLIFLIRFLKKKEDLKRFKEKLTFFSKKRKVGKLVWFHAVSVGEVLSIIPLLKILEKNKKISQILLTSSTLTSANLFKQFNFSKTVHQFFPIDSNFLVKRFLNYWKPHLVIFIDSEIWPNMLLNLKKRSISTILLNARISLKSYKKWKLLNSLSNTLFQSFELTYPQNKESEKFLRKFKVKNIKKIGNLKFAQNDMNTKNLSKDLKLFFKSKKTWCAVSTHPGEEKISAEIHKKLLKKFKNLLLIIIPRHTYRTDEIKAELSELKLNYHVHSNGKKISNRTNVYLVDTYGETGLFFDISKNIFMGKSFLNDGGQNPLEPARKNCNILYGPKVSNFKEIYKYLNDQKIAFKVKNPNKLYNKLNYLLDNTKKSNKGENKLKIIGDKILKKSVKEIEGFI
mgnify:CR=1 FL=1